MTSLEIFLGDHKDREEVQGDVLLSDYLQHLSASSIGMLFRCPRQFQHRYLFGEKERPGEGMVIGSFFHKTLEWNYVDKIESHTDKPLLDALQYLGDVAVPNVVEQEGGNDWIKWDDGSSKDAAHKVAERVTTAYYSTVVPRVQPTSVEERFEITIPGVEVPVIGYVDTQDADRVLDTKTGKAVSTKVKPSWQLQGRLYTTATKKPTEFHSINRAQSPRIVTALESDQMTVPILSEGQTQEMVRLVNTAADLIRQFLTMYGTEQEWPTWGAVPDWSRNVLPCDMCGWRKGCPAWS